MLICIIEILLLHLMVIAKTPCLGEIAVRDLEILLSAAMSGAAPPEVFSGKKNAGNFERPPLRNSPRRIRPRIQSLALAG
jgi:hypothetical protein